MLCPLSNVKLIVKVESWTYQTTFWGQENFGGQKTNIWGAAAYFSMHIVKWQLLFVKFFPEAKQKFVGRYPSPLWLRALNISSNYNSDIVVFRYVDGTFKVLRESFTQHFSLHAFVKKDGQQLPLALAVISRCRQRIFNSSHLQCCNDHAYKSSFPSPPYRSPTPLKKCCQEWSSVDVRVTSVRQWRDIQTVGLEMQYIMRRTSEFTASVVRRWRCNFCLSIKYDRPSISWNGQHRTMHWSPWHMECMVKTWMDSITWPPSLWSVYKQPVRANNDVEGWHYQSNANGSLNLYSLIHLLHGRLHWLPWTSICRGESGMLIASLSCRASTSRRQIRYLDKKKHCQNTLSSILLCVYACMM